MSSFRGLPCGVGTHRTPTPRKGGLTAHFFCSFIITYPKFPLQENTVLSCAVFSRRGQKECFDLDRLQAFESMLGAVQRGYEEASQKMQALNAQGKEKTVTYKQHMANKLLYMNMLSLYRLYGLLDQDPAQQSFPAGGSPL